MALAEKVYDDVKGFLAEKVLWYAIGGFAVLWIGYAIYKQKQNSNQSIAQAYAAVAAATAEPSSSTAWSAPLVGNGANQAAPLGTGSTGTGGNLATSQTTNPLAPASNSTGATSTTMTTGQS
jgi:hypothetical protein